MKTVLTNRRRFDDRVRGQAILMAIVLVFALAVVAIFALGRASSEADSAGAKRQADKSASCAEAARAMLISQFRTYGQNPTSITLNSTADDRRMATGHYDELNVTSVTASAGVAQSNIGATDVSNRVSRLNLGGQHYRMTVVCGSSAETGPSRQNEVEFLVKFGL